MKKRLPPWCKLVKHTLIDKDMDVSELATKTGLARPYLSSIINGRIYSQPAVNKVSDCLGISNDYDAIYQPAIQRWILAGGCAIQQSDGR